MKNEKNSIFSYNNFRKYIEDYQIERQKSESQFTKSEFSRLLQLPNTRSYINDVLKGKKVTSTFIERFINVIGFNKDEAQFFRALVKFNQAENVNEREIYFDQLISLNKSPKKVIAQNTYKYYKNWYNSVIRAILATFEFKGDYSELAKKVFPRITVKQAENSIKLLKKLNLVAELEDGTIKPTECAITTDEYIKDELIKQYQLKLLGNVEQNLIKGIDLPHSISTNVISISENNLKRIDKKINKFRSEIRSLIHKDEDKPEKVYNLNIIFIPNSK